MEDIIGIMFISLLVLIFSLPAIFLLWVAFLDHSSGHIFGVMFLSLLNGLFYGALWSIWQDNK